MLSPPDDNWLILPQRGPRSGTDLTIAGAKCMDREVAVDDNLVSNRKPREISRFNPR